MAGEQPSAIKAQGPFHGPVAAESILDTIVESLTLHGYELADDPQIWSLHLQAQLRQINGGRGRSLKSAADDRDEFIAVVGDAAACAAERERWADDRREADEVADRDRLVPRVRDAPLRNGEAAFALATFLARFWSTPTRITLGFPIDRRELARPDLK